MGKSNSWEYTMHLKGGTPSAPQVKQSDYKRGGRDVLEAYQNLAAIVALQAVEDEIGFDEDIRKAKAKIAELRTKMRELTSDPDMDIRKVEKISEQIKERQNCVSRCEYELKKIYRFYRDDWSLYVGDVSPRVIKSVVIKAMEREDGKTLLSQVMNNGISTEKRKRLIKKILQGARKIRKEWKDEKK